MSEIERCTGTKKNGEQCAAKPIPGTERCRQHPLEFDSPPWDETPELDHSGGLCAEHFPYGWPADATSAGCAHGTFDRVTE